jgi:hypothetical protein
MEVLSLPVPENSRRRERRIEVFAGNRQRHAPSFTMPVVERGAAVVGCLAVAERFPLAKARIIDFSKDRLSISRC